MAGLGNELVIAQGFRLQQSSATSIAAMQRDATDISDVNYTGSPEGNVSANPGSICRDPVSGNIYAKQTGTSDTGWVQISTGGGGGGGFSPATYVVSPTAGKGDYTTIAAALAVAVSGDTIFIRPGTYTENLTLKAGVDLLAGGQEGTTPTVTIIGKSTFTTAGTVSISGIRLQTNSDFFLAVTGSADSIVNLNNCYLNCTNNNGISYTSSSGSSRINISYCSGDVITTGITPFVMTSTGTININYSTWGGSGSSTTPSTLSAGSFVIRNSEFDFAVSTSGTGSVSWRYANILVGAINATALTTSGTGTSAIYQSILDSGTASCISVGTGTTVILLDSEVGSSNTNAITGLGTLSYGGVTFDRSSSTINTSTPTPIPWTVQQGGTAASTLTGILTGNGTSAVTANTVTQHGVLIAGASNAASSLGVASTGTVLAGATGSDPAFTATPSVTSITLSGGTALSTYVEGTWTPTLVGSSTAGSTTYNTQSGQYTKVGNLVTVNFYLICTSGGTAAGNVTIGALPFTVKNNSPFPVGAVLSFKANTWPVGTTSISIQGTANTTNAVLFCSGTASSGGNLAIQSATDYGLQGTLTYQV